MDQITVIAVEPFALGDESATVTLRKGDAVVDAFCWPCSYAVGDVLENHLSALDGEVRAAYLTDWPIEEKIAASVEHLEKTGDFSYRGIGCVFDMSAGIVEVKGFKIDFGELHCDGHVEFEIIRLDIRG